MLLLLASLVQVVLAVLLYNAAGHLAVPTMSGSVGLMFLVSEVLPVTVSGCEALALTLCTLAPSCLAVLLTLPMALLVGQLLELSA